MLRQGGDPGERRAGWLEWSTGPTGRVDQKEL